MKNVFLFSIFFFVTEISEAQANLCLVPDKPAQGVSESVRRSCLIQSLFTLPHSPVLVSEVALGPPAKIRYSSDQVVHCRFFARDQGGSSTKFRCYRTDENNQLFNNDGEIRPEAVKIGKHDSADENILYDSTGTVLKNKKGQPEKAEVLKVRYSDGSERNRENFTSSLAGHIAWILGLPAERFYPVSLVKCFGCQKNPFQEKQERPVTGLKNQFLFAAIEKKFQGPRIMKVYGNAVAWKWTEFTKLYPQMSQEQRISYEELVLAANLFHIVEERGSQHAMVCDESNIQSIPDKDDKICEQPLALIHDLGAAFGNRSLKKVSGASTMNHPRGDYAAYTQVKIFKNLFQCELTLKAGGLQRISEEGRRAFSQRLDLLTPDLLLAAIQASHFSQADTMFRNKVARQSGLQGASLDLHVSELWKDLILQKINEIKTARCS